MGGLFFTSHSVLIGDVPFVVPNEELGVQSLSREFFLGSAWYFCLTVETRIAAEHFCDHSLNLVKTLWRTQYIIETCNCWVTVQFPNWDFFSFRSFFPSPSLSSSPPVSSFLSWKGRKVAPPLPMPPSEWRLQLLPSLRSVRMRKTPKPNFPPEAQLQQALTPPYAS